MNPVPQGGAGGRGIIKFMNLILGQIKGGTGEKNPLDHRCFIFNLARGTGDLCEKESPAASVGQAGHDRARNTEKCAGLYRFFREPLSAERCQCSVPGDRRDR